MPVLSLWLGPVFDFCSVIPEQPHQLSGFVEGGCSLSFRFSAFSLENERPQPALCHLCVLGTFLQTSNLLPALIKKASGGSEKPRKENTSGKYFKIQNMKYL